MSRPPGQVLTPALGELGEAAVRRETVSQVKTLLYLELRVNFVDHIVYAYLQLRLDEA